MFVCALITVLWGLYNIYILHCFWRVIQLFSDTELMMVEKCSRLHLPRKLIHTAAFLNSAFPVTTLSMLTLCCPLVPMCLHCISALLMLAVVEAFSPAIV